MSDVVDGHRRLHAASASFAELHNNLDYARDLVRGGRYLERLQVGHGAPSIATAGIPAVADWWPSLARPVGLAGLDQMIIRTRELIESQHPPAG